MKSLSEPDVVTVAAGPPVIVAEQQPAREHGFRLATAGRFVLQAAIWGSSFSLIQFALRDMSASVLVLTRLALAAAVLAVIARARRAPLASGARTWFHVTVAAVFGNVLPYLLLSYGEGQTPAAVAGVLIGSTPLLTVLAAVLLLPGERTNGRQLAGYLVGFAGVVLVLEPWATTGGPAWDRLACLGAAGCYACGYVYVRRFLSKSSAGPMGLAVSQLIAATAVQAVLTPLLGWHVGRLHFDSVTAVLVLGLLGTGYATVLYFRLIADIGASAAASVDYLVPVFAVVFGVVLLGEAVHWNMFLGGGIVLVGVALVEGRIRVLLGRGRATARASN